MTQPQTILASELIEDFGFYPRQKVDTTHVSHIAEALEADSTAIPPIVVERKSKRIVDGFHRRRAFIRLFGDTARVPVVLRTFKSDAAMFMEAARLNAEHGKNLSPWDRIRITTKGIELGISKEEIGRVLVMRPDRVADLVRTRTARGTVENVVVPLKRSVLHLSGEKLTRKQIAGIERVGGLNLTFYVNQVLLSIEEDLADWENERFVEALSRLKIVMAEDSRIP